MEEDRYTRITLRIPKDLHARLQLEADRTSKSMNAEILSRLQSSFEKKEIPHVASQGIQGMFKQMLDLADQIKKAGENEGKP